MDLFQRLLLCIVDEEKTCTWLYLNTWMQMLCYKSFNYKYLRTLKNRMTGVKKICLLLFVKLVFRFVFLDVVLVAFFEIFR